MFGKGDKPTFSFHLLQLAKFLCSTARSLRKFAEIKRLINRERQFFLCLMLLTFVTWSCSTNIKCVFTPQGEIGTVAGSNSPLIDVEAVSDEDDHDICSGNAVGQFLYGLCKCCLSVLSLSLTFVCFSFGFRWCLPQTIYLNNKVTCLRTWLFISVTNVSVWWHWPALETWFKHFHLNGDRPKPRSM